MPLEALGRRSTCLPIASSNAMRDVAGSSGARSRCTGAIAAMPRHRAMRRAHAHGTTGRRRDRPKSENAWFEPMRVLYARHHPLTQGLAAALGSRRQEVDTRTPKAWNVGPGMTRREGRGGWKAKEGVGKRRWGEGAAPSHLDLRKLPVCQPMPRTSLSCASRAATSLDSCSVKGNPAARLVRTI